MLRRILTAILTFSLASKAATIPPSEHVYTDIKVYHTVIDEFPYLVDRTTTVVWTQGPSVTSSAHLPAQTDAANA
ncbi:hypothetical protein E4T56_gene5968 [Termitomyces sp. T112]|nr:hypothetical protein E4T56_gene5968 [Termitomyces sp. T112]KAH0582290.1 hypothetical protein H2248_011927 [Termitomyces sp. 'cryptogamus']